MSLFDALSGSGVSRATKNGQQALLAGQTLGMGQITDRLGDAQRLLLGPGGSGANALLGAYDNTKADLRGQYGETQGYLGQLSGLYQPMVDQGQRGLSAYMDAAGANGAEGNARAVANFQAGPGYQFALNEGLGAIERMASSRGMLGSGNTSADLLKYATGLADQTWGNYLNRLSPLSSLYSQGIAGQAGGLTGQAGASQAYGSALAGADQAYGTGTASLYSQLAGLNGNAGSSAAGLINNTAQGIADLGVKGAQAKQQASGNLLGGILGVASLGLTPFPAGGLGNTLAGKLFGGGGSSGGGAGGWRDDQWI